MKRIATLLIILSLSQQYLTAQLRTVVNNFNNPWGITYHDGLLYVGSNTTNRVSSLDLDDSDASLKTVANNIDGCSGLIVEDDTLYIAERNSFNISRKAVADISSTSAEACVQFKFPPVHMAAYEDNLYIGDRDGGQVLSIPSEGPCVSFFTQVVSGIQQTYGIVIRGSEVYVSQGDGGEVSKFDLAVEPYELETVVSGLNTPAGLTILDDVLYIAEFGGNMLRSFDLNDPNADLEVKASGLNGPIGLANDGFSVYIADYNGNRVMALDVISSTDEIDSQSAIALNPNPVQSTLHISGIETNTKYRIHNSSQQLVMSGKMSPQESLDVSALKPGIYLIATKEGVKRFVKI